MEQDAIDYDTADNLLVLRHSIQKILKSMRAQARVEKPLQLDFFVSSEPVKTKVEDIKLLCRAVIDSGVVSEMEIFESQRAFAPWVKGKPRSLEEMNLENKNTQFSVMQFIYSRIKSKHNHLKRGQYKIS